MPAGLNKQQRLKKSITYSPGGAKGKAQRQARAANKWKEYGDAHDGWPLAKQRAVARDIRSSDSVSRNPVRNKFRKDYKRK